MSSRLFFYHVQLFIPPTLQEPKVEENFQELPCWEATHLVWMIAWEWEIHMGMVDPNLYQTSCLNKAFRQPIVASMYFLLLHDDSYLGCSPKASLHTWEGKLGDILMRQHLDPWRILSYEVTIGENRMFFSPKFTVA